MALCSLAGDLAIFDDSRAAPELPLYDHDDLGRCYLELLRVLERLINNILPTTFIKRRFEPVETRREVALEDEWLLPEVEFYLGIESDRDDEQIDREVSFLKMGSVEDLPTLINRRLPGLMLRRIRRTPIGLPDRPNYHYYRISREGRFWDSLIQTKVLASYGLADETLELNLYILLKPSGEGE
jgi:type VI secretion system protein ImpJ